MTIVNAYAPADPPVVNDGTLTIQKNGTTVATFTANQTGTVVANISVSDVPATTGATAGQVLTYDGTGVGWATPSLSITTYS